MTPLQLNLPARNTAPGKASDLRPKEVQAWLTELPMAQPLQAGQQLLERLREINQAYAAPKVRHAALEQMHPAVQKLIATLQKSHHDAAFPLPAGHCLMATLCQQLLEEMANGYKLTLMDLLLEGDTAAVLDDVLDAHADPVLLRSLWRAVNYLGAQLLEHYLIYAPEPEGVWLDLHRLYRFAEQHLLHLLAIDVSGEETAAPDTLSGAYKSILLFALCNPYHLLQGEALPLFQQLHAWSESVKILRLSGAHRVAGAFVVDLESDTPPRYIPPSQPLPAPAQGRLIDVEELLARLEAHNQALRHRIADQQARQLPTLAQRREYVLYARLKHSWEVRQDRRFARTAQPSNLVMMTGLSAIHHFIGEEAAFTPEDDEARLRDEAAARGERLGIAESVASERPAAPWAGGVHEPEPDDEVALEDIWSPTYAKPVAGKPTRKTARDSSNFTIMPWHQRDTGRGGLSVFCVNDCRAHMRVGELVAYKRNPVRPETPWQLGAVRWLRAPDFSRVELGLMVLDGTVQAVATRALRGTGAGGDYTRSLLVTLETAEPQQVTLITPPTIYDEGTTLLLNQRDRLRRIKLIELLEATRSYARFRFTDLDPH